MSQSSFGDIRVMGQYLDDVNLNVVPSADQFGDYRFGSVLPVLSEGVPVWLAAVLGGGLLIVVFVMARNK